MHSDSEMYTIGLVFSTSMQSLPIRTTGHDFLHSFWRRARSRRGKGRVNSVTAPVHRCTTHEGVGDWLLLLLLLSLLSSAATLFFFDEKGNVLVPVVYRLLLFAWDNAMINIICVL